MAITAIEYLFLRNLRQGGLVPLGGDVLELGEANWYGDVGLNDFGQDIYRFAPEARREPLFRHLDALGRAEKPDLFAIAKVFWETFLHPASLTAIDLHGGPAALKLDLNGPVDLGRQFDVVMNLGTIEHVFNVAQALKTVHDHTRPGGLMIHGMPLSGWLDHGFYSFNSTFYWDLAGANGYETVIAVYAQLEPPKFVTLKDRGSILRLAEQKGIAENSLIYTVLRRPGEARPFAIPMQGYYAGELSAEAAETWKTAR